MPHWQPAATIFRQTLKSYLLNPAVIRGLCSRVHDTYGTLIWLLLIMLICDFFSKTSVASSRSLPCGSVTPYCSCWVGSRIIAMPFFFSAKKWPDGQEIAFPNMLQILVVSDSYTSHKQSWMCLFIYSTICLESPPPPPQNGLSRGGCLKDHWQESSGDMDSYKEIQGVFLSENRSL